MVPFLYVLSYFIMSAVAAGIIDHFDSDCKKARDTKGHDYPLGGVVFVSLIWPISLACYGTAGILRLPEKTRARKIAKLERENAAELTRERHKTALAEERALQAGAEARILKEYGLPSIGQPLP